MIGEITHRGKTVVDTDQGLGGSQTQESILPQDTEEIIYKPFFDFHIKIYHHIPAKNNVYRASEWKVKIDKVEPAKQEFFS